MGTKGNDISSPVHDGTVGLDWPLNELTTIVEVDYKDFGRGGSFGLLSNTNPMVGLESLFEYELDKDRVETLKRLDLHKKQRLWILAGESVSDAGHWVCRQLSAINRGVSAYPDVETGELFTLLAMMILS